MMHFSAPHGKVGRVTVRSRFPLTRLAVLALTATVVWLCLTTDARADGGVPIPAPAGTEWEIVAGYNTASHSDADAGDPHAIDIVRIPREDTSGTPVLSPVDGTVRWLDWDCLMITDAAGYEHLLCHVSPLGHLQRGSSVAIGEQVAVVCREFECGNYGLAHIHYAIHESRGGGYLGRSIPFTGRYAIEGRELHWSPEHNLHSGVEFTSTNTRNWTAPSVEPSGPSQPNADADTDTPDTDEDLASLPEPEPEPDLAWAIPADAPVGGWRMVGVYEDSSVAGFFANLVAPLSEIVVHHAVGNDYDRFDPTDPASADVAVRSLGRGQAVWALVEADAAWLPAPPREPRQVTIRLYRGANLISWQGPDRHVSEALRNVAHFSHAYRYAPYSKTWYFWSPGAPDFLNTLGALRSGDALYVFVRAGSIWTQLP